MNLGTKTIIEKKLELDKLEEELIKLRARVYKLRAAVANGPRKRV